MLDPTGPSIRRARRVQCPAGARGHLLPTKSTAFACCRGLTERVRSQERDYTSVLSATLTAVSVVPNDRHAVVSCEYEGSVPVAIKLGEQRLSLAHDCIDYLDICHIFLAKCELVVSEDKLETRAPSNEDDMSGR